LSSESFAGHVNFNGNTLDQLTTSTCYGVAFIVEQ